MNNQETTVVNLINFHGTTMWVVAHENIEYIYAKPLVELAGLAWRSAKKVFFEPDNVTLYGTKELNHPVFAAEGHLKVTPSTGVYIRLDRSRMYLAGIQVSRVRANGKHDAAEHLLKLQIEWAEALHHYETDGVAYKRDKKDGRQQLINLLKNRNAATSVGEKHAITRMIHDTFAELGYPVVEDVPPQQELSI